MEKKNNGENSKTNIPNNTDSLGGGRILNIVNWNLLWQQ